MQPAIAVLPVRRVHLRGVCFAIAAVSIWAGWSALTRLAVTTGLDAWDVAALRFGIAGVLLSPLLVRRGLAIDRLGWPGLAGLVIGLGAPYALFAAAGLRFAPASDQGALNPGCMPLFVALIATLILGRTLSKQRKLGLSLILAGILLTVGWHSAMSGTSRPLGDLLFLMASLLSAAGTVIMRQAELAPVHAAALISTGSFVVYLPIYFGVHQTGLTGIPLTELGVQALFQGVVVTIIALLLYGRAVLIIGASAASAFGALVPALSALLAIPLLGEWPDRADWLAILLISTGVYLAGIASAVKRSP